MGSPPAAAARLRETARRLSEAEVEVVNLRARCQAMQMELASERKRAGDAEAMAATVRNAARSAVGSSGPSSTAGGGDVTISITDKKSDVEGGVEGALLGGGDSTFVPMAGMLRRGPQPCHGAGCLAAARAMDRATVALHRRPVARLVLSIYLLAVHASLLVA